MKSLFKTVFIIIFFTGLTRLAGFVFRIWLSRTIGTESLGIYQISFSIFMVLLTLISSGLPLIVSRLTAKFVTEKNKTKEHQTTTAATIIAFILSLIICLVVIIFRNLLSNLFTDNRCVSILLALLPALIFSSIYSIIRGNLWGKKKYTATCSAELFEQILRIIICVILFSGIFPNISGEIGAALSLSIACFFSCIFVVCLYLKSGGKFKKPVGYKEIIKTSTPITCIRIVTSLIQPIVSIIIPMQLVAAGYTSSQALSLFGVATGMTMPLLYIPLTVIGSLSYALVPDLSSAVAKQDKNYVSTRVNSSILFSLFVAFFIVPLFIGAGENIGIFFFDNAQSGILLSSSAWIIVPLCITNISSTILNSIGLEVKSFKNYIIGGISMLVCLWILPKYIGINALIWAMGSCFTISSILNIKMIKKHSCTNLNLGKHFLKFTLFSIPTAAITSFTTNILSMCMPLFFNLAISCTLGATFFILLCLMFNVFTIKTVSSWIKENIFKNKKAKHKV